MADILQTTSLKKDATSNNGAPIHWRIYASPGLSVIDG